MLAAKPLSRKRALSTIETLIATAILGLSVIALFGSFILALQLTQREREKSIAQHLAEQKIEQLRDIGYANLVVDSNPPAETVSQLPGGQRKTYVENYGGSDRIKKVTVKVYWNNRAESQAITLVTLIAQGGISD